MQTLISTTVIDTADALFRAAFDHAAIGMVIGDRTGRFIRVNSALCTLLGRTAEELEGRDSSWISHPDDHPSTRTQVEQASGVSFEKRYIHKNGSVIWARVTISPAGDFLVATAEDITEQKRTREELIETRRKLKSALIAGEVATYEWDVKSDRLWGDANFDQIFGTERDADGTAPLSRFVEAIHPDDRDRVMAAVNHTVATGADYDIEYRIVNGSLETWVSARGRLERDDDQKIVRFHGVIVDITGRKRAEQELQRRTHLYDTFLSGTDDLAYLIDREGRFIFANRALLDLWGMTMEEVNGKTLYDLGYPKWHADMNMREFAQIFETGKGITGEVPYTSPTGVSGLYEYVFSPVLDANGEVDLIAGTSRDATEQRKAAQIQRELADQLRLALEAAQMGWWQLDIDTNRAFWDARARAIFGIAEDVEARPEDVLALMLEEDAERARAVMRAATDPRDPQPYSVEYRLRMPDGSIRWISSKANVFFEGEGDARRAVRVVGTVLDVTAVKTAQESLQHSLESERAARAESERVGRIKDEFLATLSHELRTPLSAILGWAQILGAGGNSNEEIAEGISVIARNARAQAQIIEDLLEMSRIISGKIRLDVQRLNLVDVVNAAVDTVRAAANAKGVRITVDAGEERHEISGDVNRLQQVFWNLLSNAVKFTPAGGSIAVRIARVETHIEVSVADTGDGIRSEFLPYVFDRFRQADASTTRLHGGLGLGLAIVKHIAELHGGSVRVASDGIGKGATFTVLLPLVAAKQEDDVPWKSSRVRTPDIADMCNRVGGLRVLVVDDEPDARDVVRRFLEDCEIRVTMASSVAEALALMAAEQFDVLISDIGMPREDGYSLIEKVRASGNKIPAIALTAYARPDDRVRVAVAGFSTHVAKPANPAELVAIVASLAGRR